MIYKGAEFSNNFIGRLGFLLSAKLLFTLFAIFVFARFTPLVDANLYLSGFYDESNAEFRTRIIQQIVLKLSTFGGPIFVHWAFGGVSLTGVIYYYWRGGTRWYICIPFLLPSALIWSSIIGKEAIFFGAFTLALVIWVRFLLKQCDLTDYVLLALGTTICLLLRPHYAMAIFWLFASGLLTEIFKNRAWIWLCLLAFTGIQFLLAYAWEPLLYRGFGGIEPTARASRFAQFGIEPGTAAGFGTFKSLLPLGMLLGIIGPMPHEVYARPILLPFLLEGILLLLSPTVVYFYASKQSFTGKQRFQAVFWMCLVPAILLLIVIHAPFGLLNPGSATRWRVNFEAIFYFAPILLFYAFFDNDRYVNHPLPS